MHRGLEPVINSTALQREPTIAIMSEKSTSKAGQELAVVRGERGRLQPGGGSLNPTGRPKKHETRSGQVQRNGDWTAYDARMSKIILNPKSKDSDAIAAYRELNDRAWGKPLSSHELTVSRAEDSSMHSLSHLTDEQIAARLAWLRGQSSAIDTEAAPTNPVLPEGVLDGGT